MIRVVLPYHLRNLAGVGSEISIEVSGKSSVNGIVDRLEQQFPSLKGTIRDSQTGIRRPFIRFFMCGKDWSHESQDSVLPAEVLEGKEPLFIVGAMAGG